MIGHGKKPGRRWLAVCAAVTVTMAVPAAAAAAPNQPSAPRSGAVDVDFSSSFETADPQPAWTDTVETDGQGRKKAAGVDGSSSSAGIPGNVTDKVVEVTASGEYEAAGEIKENLVDGDVYSKWLVFDRVGWARFKLAQPVAVVHYALSSANDVPERDPKDWTLQGSQDGQNWTTLDTQTDQTFSERHQTKEYRFANTQAYLYYRLDITRNGGIDIVQLAEVQLSNGDTTPAPPSDMKSIVSRGPRSAPAAKANVGFTGLKALQYSGHHTGAGRGYSYNKVFDVDIRVAPRTELSYLIFPELTGGDLRYPSTYASVDLAFSDGSYLSDLGAEDQHGAKLSPPGQGESKTLYANQWNHKVSRIGAVAKGKRITRILVAYDNPDGPAEFKGWVDDITIVSRPAQVAAQTGSGRPSDYVVTTRGTHATSSFSRGNNIPATAVPHGFNFWVPMTNAGSTSWLYDYHRANNADNLPRLQAFLASHEPSPWMGDRQTFEVMPSAATGTPNPDRASRALAFSHENEVAQAHYYSVKFENGIRTEIAPTDHAAVFRFTFTGDTSNLIFDNINNSGGLILDADGAVTGYSDVKSALSEGATRIFLYATFDKPVTASEMLPGSGRPNVTGYVQFDTAAQRHKVVTMRIATSLISVAQAKRNLELEVGPQESFDEVKERARRLWDAKLGVIEVEGASPDQRTTLYSSLYRLFLYPNSGFENTGTQDRPVYRYASPFDDNPALRMTAARTDARIMDGKLYINNGFWDTYRTAWPAYALLTPKHAGEMIDGFVQHYKDGGWMSRWSSPGYANLMTGTSSDVAFADAYQKGVRNFDMAAAYDAALKNATVVPPNPNVGRKGLDTSIFLGYTPTSTGEGMSWALEGYVNDFGIAGMAKALYERTDQKDPRRKQYQEQYEYFRGRALNYVHMFDRSVGFFQGRAADGTWRLPPDKYDPRVWGHDYTETNGWNMAFTVPHDGQGLANLYGGRQQLADKLDQFFATPETAKPEFAGHYGGIIHEMVEARDVRMGMYGHSNQPSHHIIYMYDYAGQPWKAQAKVREVLSRLYLGSEIGQGYPGDEDNGEMSAWYIFSALGFYPLQMGSPYYAIGSPLFTKATVHLENGRKIVVNAPKNSRANVYVQGLRVDGKPYGKTYLTHQALARGAVLDFDMGPKPSRWGTGTGDVPPSVTSGTGIPRPLQDVTGPGKGVATGSGGTDVAGLFDDTSATRVAFDGRTPWAQYRVTGPREQVGFYTLTSGKEPGDPRSWALKGSYDGKAWVVLDRRAAERFPWRLQTRAFKIDRPGRYGYYRIEVAENTGEPSTSLAEVELLAERPPCTSTVSGTHTGDLNVSSGVLCLDGAAVTGSVTVRRGAALFAAGGSIGGSLRAAGAAAVVLANTKVGRSVLIGTTRRVSIENAKISGPVYLANNTAAGPPAGGSTGTASAPVVAGSTIGGPLYCSGNRPPPVNNGLPNTLRGPAMGQCRAL